MISFDYRGLTGQVITKDDFEYEEQRKTWNRSIEKYPLVIVNCQTEQDIKNAILFAKSNSLLVRVRSGRHHYEGYSTGNDIVVIDISRMKKINIDEKNETVKVQAGVLIKDFCEEIGKLGYPFPIGESPSGSVIGFTLGGGWSYSSRLLGLGCDRLVEAELIDSNGKLIVCNKDKNEDLFWALRGCGGGNFGIVTSMTFNLPPKIDKLTLVNIDFKDIDFEENINLIEVWQEQYKVLDKRANFKMEVYNSKENGRGVKITGLVYGDKRLANDILKPLKDIVSNLSYSLKYIDFLEANKIIQNDNLEYKKFKGTGNFVYKDFTREEIIELLKLIDETPEGSLNNVITLYGLGGIIREVKKDSTAFYHRDANFILSIKSIWEEQKYAKENREWVSEKLKYIKSITDGAFVNFACLEIENYEKEYYGENAELLKKIKEKYDKEDFFNFEQDIRIEKKLWYNILVE